MGSGYVFSDEFVDDETALQEYKNHLDSHNMVFYDPNRSKSLEFKKIEIRNGYHERFWVKNVCAIGLSNGFIEPLESTGLMMIHQFVLNLVSTLENREYITNWDISSFNKNNVTVFKNITKFVTYHYQLSQRDDTPYWKKITMEKNYPEHYFELSEQLFNNKNYTYHNMACIGIGLGFRPITPSILNTLNFNNDTNIENNLKPFFLLREKQQQQWKNIIDKTPTHYEYLRDNIYYEN
jgi:tryptophan halogenase